MEQKSLTGSLLFHFDPARTSAVVLQHQVEELLNAAPTVVDEACGARGPLTLLREQVSSGPGVLLMAGAGLAVLSGAPAEAALIGAVWLVNVVAGFATERFAEQTLQAPPAVNSGLFSTLRQGQRLRLEATSLRVGDVVTVEGGQIIPADGLLLQSQSLVVDESLLTGESQGTPKWESNSELWMGTQVLSGSAKFQLSRLGRDTRVGQIYRFLAQGSQLPGTLNREFGQLVRALGGVTAALGLPLLAVGAASGLATAELLSTAISLLLSIIPEGLSSVSLLALVLGVRRLRSRGVVVRRLSALAGLGRTQVMCLDKTGTLTRNRVRLALVVVKNRDYPPQEWAHPSLRQAFELALLACAPRSPSSPYQAPADKALREAAEAQGIRGENWQLVDYEGRGPDRAYTVGRATSPNGTRVVAIKGAAEQVLALCDHYFSETGRKPLTARQRREILDRDRQLARTSLRVLGLASLHGDSGVWHGLLGFEDEMRGGADSALAFLARSGLRNLVLTGDQAGTVAGLLDTMGIEHRESDTAALPGTWTVRARQSPEDKLRVVREFQAQGQVVAVVGDGFNDSPALSRADVAIVMAHGAEASRSVADLVITNERLDGLAGAVGEGQAVMLDIRRALRYLLSSTFADLGLIGACLLARIPFPMSGRQLLWMNLVSDLLPALALVGSPREGEPSSGPVDRLLDRSTARAVGRDSATIGLATLTSYLWALSRYGVGARANTVAFSAINLAEIFYVLSCVEGRSPVARPVAASVALAGAAQLATVLVPFLSGGLGTVSLSLVDWLVVGASTSAVVGLTRAMNHSRKSGHTGALVGFEKLQ